LAEISILAWIGIVILVGLNGFAAGAAAILHLWRSRLARGTRSMLAAALAGALPASFLIVIPMADSGMGEPFAVFLLAFAVVLAGATAVSLPGAIIVSKKLEKPGEEFRAFE
jgi:hypothetical protein